MGTPKEDGKIQWPDIKKTLALGSVSSLKEQIPQLKTKPTFSSMYEGIQSIWNKPEADEMVDLLLGLGTLPFNFLLIWHGLASRSSDLLQRDLERTSLDVSNFPPENQIEPFGLDPEILAERILDKTPLVIYEKMQQPKPEIGKTLLHYAIDYDAKRLLHAIIRLFTTNKVQNPEETFIVRGEHSQSPMMSMVKQNKISMFQDILQALPTLRIDESVLLQAINLKRNEILHTLAMLRPDCINVSLTEYCISSQQDEILDDIFRLRPDILSGHGLLHYAVRQGDEKFVKKLVSARPDLAVEDDNGSTPLHCLLEEDVKQRLDIQTRKRIRNSILPSVIRKSVSSFGIGPGRVSPIEHIRRILADPEDHRKEISLDLGGFRHSSKSIEPFLKMIKGMSVTVDPTAQQTRRKTEKKLAPLLTVEFESTLRYVDIPILPFPRLDFDYQSVPERREALSVLEWLRHSKKVTGIYELRIRDSLYLPHTEQIIADCLYRFDVEVLDWMRVDMSIKPLMDTCPNLKKLNLYVSNWANLNYWISGGVYGHLSTFSKLEEINIFILADLIGASYSASYEKEIRRLEQDIRCELANRDPPSAPKFTMNFYLRSWSSLTIRHEEPAHVKKSTATEVTQLGAYIEAYSLLQSEFLDKDFRDENEAEAELSPIVNVAVIDTGVDPDSIQCSEISGASFVSSESGESPWWFSYHPHGTQMAKVITDLNPRCRLLVAKVGDSVMDMTVDRVIQALNWAVKSKADVISISAAFFKHSNEFEAAIQDAIAAKTVVIASTAGEAYRQEESYPAKFPEVIKIAATDRRGRETAESLTKTADFMFPGENIVAKTTFLGSNNAADEISGTSVATAIASGVASLIIACHRLSLSRQNRNQAWIDHRELKRKLVKDVFTEMVDNSGKFVKPWLFFGDSEDQSSWGEARSTLEWLSQKQFPI